MEHLYPRDIKKTFQELNRVSKNNSQIIIHTSPTSFYMEPIYFILQKILGRKEFKGNQYDINFQNYFSFRKNISIFQGDIEIWTVKSRRFFTNSVIGREEVTEPFVFLAKILDYLLDSAFLKFILKINMIKKILATDLWAKIDINKNRNL